MSDETDTAETDIPAPLAWRLRSAAEDVAMAWVILRAVRGHGGDPGQEALTDLRMMEAIDRLTGVLDELADDEAGQ